MYIELLTNISYVYSSWLAVGWNHIILLILVFWLAVSHITVLFDGCDNFFALFNIYWFGKDRNNFPPICQEITRIFNSADLAIAIIFWSSATVYRKNKLWILTITELLITKTKYLYNFPHKYGNHIFILLQQRE